ncbi:hypothetical protein PLESTF_001655600 [Pleodorina starrii]|nr:hypothetical protein PLESTF_001655600 [Pleodorina starrii]
MLCVTWLRTDGPMGQSQCAALVAAATKATAGIPLSAAPAQPFACDEVVSNTAVACATYRTPADASAVATKLDGQATTDILFMLNATSATVVENGQLTCKPSVVSYVVTDMFHQSVCRSNGAATACSKPQPDEFPYCTCEPGLARQTPYGVTYSRRFIKGSNTFFCFKIRVNRTQCGNARCCNMDLAKVEWLSGTNADCWSAVSGFTLSSDPKPALRSAVWMRPLDSAMSPGVNTTVGVLKANNLNLNTANADGVEMCIALKRASRTCSTMKQFCFQGTCKYAIFNRASSCCATDYAPGKQFNVYNRRLY